MLGNVNMQWIHQYSYILVYHIYKTNIRGYNYSYQDDGDAPKEIFELIPYTYK